MRTLTKILPPISINTGEIHLIVSFVATAIHSEIDRELSTKLSLLDKLHIWKPSIYVLSMMVLVVSNLLFTKIHDSHRDVYLKHRESPEVHISEDLTSTTHSSHSKFRYKRLFDMLLIANRIVFVLVALAHITWLSSSTTTTSSIPYAELMLTPFLALLLDSSHFTVFISGFVCIIAYLLLLTTGTYRKYFEVLGGGSGGGSNPMFSQDEIYVVYKILPIYFFFVHRTYQLYAVQAEALIHETVSTHKNFMLETLLNNLPAILWTVDNGLGLTFCRGAGLPKVRDVSESNFGSLIMKDELSCDNHVAALQGKTISYTHKFPFIPDKMFKTSLAPFRNESGNICGAVGLSLDVTELIAAKEALKQSQENYKSLIDSINDMIVKIDSSYEIEFVNQPFLGLTKDQLVGSKLTSWFEDDEKLLAEVRTSLGDTFTKGTSSAWEWMKPDPAASNTLRYFATKASPIIKGDKVVGATLITADVTERHRVQEQKRIADEMRVASKSKSEFICQMSHEIRNPLNAILGSLQLLACSNNISKMQAEHITDATENAKLLLAIISDVLDLAKIESGKLEIVNESASIAEIVETSAVMIATQAESKGLEIYSSIDTAIPDRAICDKNRISQIIMNYASNSVKFTNSGHITLSVKLVEDLGSYMTVRFECSDSGVGIRDKHLKSIFKPFVQVASKKKKDNSPDVYKGWGLGLEICNRLAQLMNGTVGVHSTYGKGSTFFIDLPLKKVSTLKFSDRLVPSDYPVALLLNFDPEFQTILRQYLTALHVEKLQNVSSSEDIENALSKHQGSKVVIIADEIDKDLALRHAHSGNRVVILNGTSHTVAERLHEDPIVYVRKPLRVFRLMNALVSDLKGFNSLAHDSEVLSLTPLPAIGEGHIAPRDLQILCVEDNAINRKIMNFMLRKLGIVNIDSACDGLEGLQKVKEKEQAYDIVFMDLQMPQMSGIECTSKIRELADIKKAHTPIVAVTANADVRTIESCLAMSFNDVLTKPVSIETLVQLIRKFSKTI